MNTRTSEQVIVVQQVVPLILEMLTTDVRFPHAMAQVVVRIVRGAVDWDRQAESNGSNRAATRLQVLNMRL